MALPQLSIDIANGAIAIDGTDAFALLKQLYATHLKQQGKAMYLGDALLKDIPVSVIASAEPSVFRVSIKPPAGLDFWQSERRATEICETIAHFFSAPPTSFSLKRSWGSVTLLNQWRDGGWGAFFEIERSA
jgi:hypothetical protein